MSSAEKTAIVTPRGQGQLLTVLGERVSLKVPGSAVGGRFSLVQIECPPGSGPPLHVHSREDEMFYVLKGRLEIRCGSDTLIAEAGDTAVLPVGVPHTFRNCGNEVAEVLVTMVPGGFEGFFLDIDRLERAGDVAPETVIEVGRKYGLEFLPDQVPNP
ncbi:MAG: cupin domain-containing protein [Candidatus Hydrogenedentes bacterium]|nr:cupin domain-containing protein [Candidatus Hydrogenedentota bacterium]